ncbi:hypothetical protein OCUBac02_47760 (plasmid) [Bosea sp. ANAM02]|nr:hypothetical protein OCUBac02_47760 [Bosea sp. ANAM02]
MKAYVLAFVSAVLLTPAHAAPIKCSSAEGGVGSQRLPKGLTTRQVQRLSIQDRAGVPELGGMEARSAKVGMVRRETRPTRSGQAYTVTVPRAYLSPFEANALAIHVGVL